MKFNLFSRKTALLALLLAAALFLSGCNLVVKDPEVDAKQVIIKVNDEVVTKEQFNVYYNNAYERAQAEQEQMQQFGYPAQPIDAQALLDSTIENVVRDKALHQKAHELKLDEYNAEELAEIDEQAQASYQSILDQIKMYYFQDTKLTGEELDKAIERQALDFGFTKDLMVENAKETKLHDKLHAYAGEGIEVTDEEVKTAFEEKVKAEQETYTANPAAFGDKVLSDEIVYYTPGGYRYVRQILLPLETEDQNAIASLESEKSSLQAALTTAQSGVNSYLDALKAEEATEANKTILDAQAAVLSEEEKAQLEELLKAETLDQAALDALLAKTPVYTALKEAQEALDSKQSELTAKETEAFGKIQATTDEIYQKAIAEGADFDALISENNNDPGQPAEGYAVSEGTTTFVDSFTKGAMALANIGDVSEPIKSNYGYHILKYVSDIQEGPASLETHANEVRNELLHTKQDENYARLEEQWLSEFKVETYPERVTN